MQKKARVEDPLVIAHSLFQFVDIPFFEICPQSQAHRREEFTLAEGRLSLSTSAFSREMALRHSVAMLSNSFSSRVVVLADNIDSATLAVTRVD